MPTAETNRDEMVRLVEFLRQNPESLSLAPEAIAAQANASLDVVRQAVSGSQGARPVRTVRNPAIRVDFGRLMDRLFAKPVWYLAITYGLALVVIQFINSSPSVSSSGSSTVIKWGDALEVVVLGAMVVLHMACYAWRGLSRYALIGGAMIGVVGTTATVVSTLRNPPVKGVSQLPLFLGAAVILLALLYTVLGVGVASLGAYIRFRREDRSLRRRSRQQLLARLFEIEEALRTPREDEPVRKWRLLEWARPRVFWVALGLGVAVTLLMSVSTIFLPGPSGEVLRQVEEARRTMSPEEASKLRAALFKDVAPGFFLIQFVFAGISILLQFGVSFLGGRPWRSVLISLTYALGSTAAGLIPIGTMGYRWLQQVEMVSSFVSGIVMAVLIGLFAGLGAFVEERAHRARRRVANDPATLLAEFVEIQRMLNSAGQSQCVVVVDAAKSSLMKANADPLVAEWSFRAYQEFLAGIVRECRGRIHATAGDGAMAAFDRAEDAFLAARTIQTRIADFNAYVNRLKDPFRLRIGIHCGEVSGNLDEVEFTAVLDVAAHVESMSQVGGIAVTSSVKEQLPQHRFAEIQETVDGFRVFLALNPTLDPEATDADA